MPTDTDFGSTLRRLRRLRDLTQESLAELVGCSDQTIRAIESGRRRASRAMLERMAQVLELPAEERDGFVRLGRSSPAVEINQAEPAVADFPPPAAPRPTAATQPTPYRLPESLNPLIGREEERNTLVQRLRDPACRLLTLVGPGGMGKTHLASQLFGELAPEYADGAVSVALAGVETPAAALAALASSFGLPATAEAPLPQRLVEHLRERSLLLLLDNLEQLLGSPTLPEFIGTMLREAPGVRVLATSRESLRLRGEWVYQLTGLSLPQDASSTTSGRSDAVLLFLDCARRLVHDFALSPDNQAAIVRICQLVEGMPLALELAAAWVTTLSPAEIAAEIERSLDFLALADRDMAPHHRSMRVVFERSWHLLTTEEQSMLARLALFRGGFTREAAAFVARASLPQLAVLMQKSLLRRPGPARYDLHEVIRHYSSQRLSPEQQQETMRRHLDYHLALAAQAGLGFTVGEHQPWVNQLAPEMDNLRVALRYGLEVGNEEKGARLCGALYGFWHMQSLFREGLEWSERYLRHPVQPETRARLLSSVSLLAYLLGDLPKALQSAAEAVALQEELNDPVGMGDALQNLATAEMALDRLSEAQTHLEQALTLWSVHGTPTQLSRAYNDLGSLHYAQGRAAEACHWYDEALALARQSGDRLSIAIALANLGAVRTLDRDQRGLAEVQEGLKLLHEFGYMAGVAICLEVLAGQAGLRGDQRHGALLLGAADALRVAANTPITPDNQPHIARLAALARGDMAEALFESHRLEGRSLTLAEAVALALA
ncbi:MAG: tetratricopeptide repeat protein [Chloroflexaceae bacterium]|nr:tetratricopeptide repeat protein [Chloroflexaceae bacterium]